MSQFTSDSLYLYLLSQHSPHPLPSFTLNSNGLEKKKMIWSPHSNHAKEFDWNVEDPKSQ